MNETPFTAEFCTTPWWWEAAPPPSPTVTALPDSADALVIGGGI